jgi:hypothetical protein
MFAFFISRKNTPVEEQNKYFQVPLYPYIPIAALLISTSLLIPVGGSGLATGFIWILMGLTIYFCRRNVLRP